VREYRHPKYRDGWSGNARDTFPSLRQSPPRHCVKTIAYPGGAVAVIGRRAERQIGDAAFVIDGDHIPGVHAGAVFPAVAVPVPKLGSPGSGMALNFHTVLPLMISTAADIAAGAVGWAFLTSRADNDDVLIHRRHGVAAQKTIGEIAITSEVRKSKCRPCRTCC